MIVSFSGMDGAGKSTQIHLMCKYLKQMKDEQFYYIWSRGGYTSGIEFIKLVARKFFRKGLASSGKSKARTESLSRPWISYIWLTVAMLDLMVLYGVIVRFRSFFGEVVICDRYLGDTALDFTLNFSQINFEKMWLWHLLKFITPEPNLSFLLLIPVSASIDRSKLKNDPFPEDKETLKNRLIVYQTSAWFDDCIKIDSMKSIDAVSEQIIERIILSDAA